jgi:uncharacterized repeat protein (TIGR03803 family)
VLHVFRGGREDGCNPYQNLTMDEADNLFGTAPYCGASDQGTVFKLTKTGKETILHNFAGHMWTALGMGVSVSLIAAAIYDYATGNHVRALIMGGAGLVGFSIAYFFSKKKPELTPPPPMMKDSGNATATATGGSGGSASIGDITINLPPAQSAAAAPAPALDTKHKPSCNIHFTDVKLGNMDETRTLLPVRVGQSNPFAAAVFENKVIKGEELRIPLAKARVIYRHADGHDILDLSNLPWIPGAGKIYTRFEANTPQYLLLFFLDRGRLMSRSIEYTAISLGRRGSNTRGRDYHLAEPISSVEIQILTEQEELYRVVLAFTDDGSNALPRLIDFKEL